MAEHDVLSEALALPAEERARIAHQLILSLEEEPPADPAAVERAWAEEIRRRIDDLEAGRVRAIPADTAFAQVRGALGRKRK
ncbi:MAG: addiction module protein [Myxococcales bacterium]|nr:addiction module protein [Myxococcales bacterium]